MRAHELNAAMARKVFEVIDPPCPACGYKNTEDYFDGSKHAAYCLFHPCKGYEQFADELIGLAITHIKLRTHGRRIK